MNETAMQILTTLVAALGGGGIAAAWFKRQTDKGTQKKDFFSVITDRLDKEIVRLNERIQELEQKLAAKDVEFEVLNTLIKEREAMIQELEKDKTNYLAIIQVLESGAEYLPFPYWLKDNDGVMVTLNKAYEDAFLRPLGFTKSDYIGNKDEAIWSQDVAKALRNNDAKAAKSKDRIWIGEEAAAAVLKGWEFMKFSRYFEGQLIGIGGLAIRKDYFKND